MSGYFRYPATLCNCPPGLGCYGAPGQDEICRPELPPASPASTTTVTVNVGFYLGVTLGVSGGVGALGYAIYVGLAWIRLRRNKQAERDLPLIEL